MRLADESTLHFRPLQFADLELMRRWLNGDFVARWWPGWPTLEQVRAKYAPRIAGKDPTRSFIVERESKPIGFIQCYRDVADAPHLRALLDEPERAAGIDLFIGERANAFCGLGPRIIRRFLREIVFAASDTSACIIDPAQNNAAAIRAYEKSGFRFIGTVHAPGELEPSSIMMIRREDFTRDA